MTSLTSDWKSHSRRDRRKHLSTRLHVPEGSLKFGEPSEVASISQGSWECARPTVESESVGRKGLVLEICAHDDSGARGAIARTR